MSEFYVYVHRRLTDNKPFYVGKGKNRRAWRFKGRNEYWTRVHKKHGTKVEIVFDNLSEEDALRIEADTVLEFQYFGYPLTNLTSGGEKGYRFSEESKKKMSESQKTSELSKLARLKTSEAMKGRKLPDSHRKNISEAHKGKPKTKEHIEKVRKANLCTKVYVFTHDQYGDFEGTRFQFSEYSGLTRQQVSCLFGKRCANKSLGWSIKFCVINNK